MRDVLDGTGAWFDTGRPFALATVIRTWQSAPREPGASMAVGDDGEVLGSVSGGCVEAALVEVAQEVLATGAPRTETYGVSDESMAPPATMFIYGAVDFAAAWRR